MRPLIHALAAVLLVCSGNAVTMHQSAARKSSQPNFDLTTDQPLSYKASVNSAGQLLDPRAPNNSPVRETAPDWDQNEEDESESDNAPSTSAQAIHRQKFEHTFAEG